MKNINVKQIYFEPLALYQKAKTKSQRALVGYMVKAGYARDPIYGGAFKLLREIEGCTGVYVLDTKENPETTMEIIHITESAMLGMWDDFAFSEREMQNLSIQFGDFHKKGGR